MDALHKIVVALHLLGMAAVVGGWLATRGSAKVSPVVVWGARAQIVTGLILVGIAEAGDDPVNHAKIGVKLVLALVVAAFAEIGASRARKGESHATQIDVAGGAGVVAALVAALW